MAIVELTDGSILASGGAGRNQLFHLPREGGTAGTPLATLNYPIFALALDSEGRLWAATGGGPLLRLDPVSGAILGQFGDSITQAVAVHPVNHKIYVSSGNGIEIFDPATQSFSHFSDERVGNLAFAPDGTLWGARWPSRGAVLRFDSQGKAETVVRFELPVDSLAFGKTGTNLAGLLFITTNSGELIMFDLNTRQSLIVARGGSRGDIVTATSDGRVLISQTHEIDVFKPLVAPHVLTVNPPDGVTVPLPLTSILIRFDQDMLVETANHPNSVVNPKNYQLLSDGISVSLQTLTYDRASRTAVLTFKPLAPGNYQVRVFGAIQSEAGLALAEERTTTFKATADLTSILDVQFTNSRSDRVTGTVSFDVTIANTSTHQLLLPLILQLAPSQGFDGEPMGAAGRAADGSWLIDLSENFPASGILNPGQSTTGRTVTVSVPARQPVGFDPRVSGLFAANVAPAFLTSPVTTAIAGQTYKYPAAAFDQNGDPLSYLMVRGPPGMMVDAVRGLLTWTPSLTSAERVDVILQVYDSAGAHDTQAFAIQVSGVNRAPVLTTLPAEIQGHEGERLEILVQANDPDDDPLVYWGDYLPPGAIFDATQQKLVWTPTFADAGTYPGVTFAVSDGLHSVLQRTAVVITPAAPPLAFLQPPDVVVREGDNVFLQLQATGTNALPLTFSSLLLPPGSSLDPKTGVFTWTPDFTQNGLYIVPLKVSNGESDATQTLGIAVLNVNAPPVFANLDMYEGIEGQELQIRADARDPDNPLFAPPDKTTDGTLVRVETSVSSMTVTASNLPAGATFDAETLLLHWTPGYDTAGTFSVTFTATDDGNGTGVPQSATKTITIHIANVNRAPQIPDIPNQTVQRGATLELPVSISEPDGDPVALAVTGLPRFATFTDNGNGSGLFRFTPDFGDRGDYAITLRATDNGDGGGPGKVLFKQVSFILTAESANEPPKLEWIGDKVAVADAPLLFTLKATDADQKPLTFTADGLPEGATITPTTYGQAVVQWTPVPGDIGSHNLTFRVSDDGNGNANLILTHERTIKIVVRVSNAAPVLSAITDKVVAEGVELKVTPVATDANDDSLTWSIINLPAGATFDPATGVFTWKPAVFQRGNYSGITITASDGNLSVSQGFAIQVTKTNQTPTLFAIADQAGHETVQMKFTLSATDVDGDSVTFLALTALPAGAQLNGQTGQFLWTPTYQQSGD